MMNRLRAPSSRAPFLLAAGIAGVASGAAVRGDDPVSSAVRFNREIIRIIQRKCEPCHAAGSLVMSLSTYRDARAWGRAIREELVEQRMPPNPVAPGYGRFQSEPSLTAREMMTMLTWLDGGMPRGDENDLPARSVTNTDGVHDVDARVDLPRQEVPAGEDLIVRHMTVDAGSAAGRRISRVLFHPGDRRAVRGALVFVGPPGGRHRWVGAWLPWQHAIVPPSSHAFSIGPTERVVVDIYYRGGDEAIADRSALGFTFADPATRAIDDLVIESSPVPAHSAASSLLVKGEHRLLTRSTVWAIQPEADASVQSMELRARRPDGTIDVLFWMPQVRHDWPHALVLREPLVLPAGTVIAIDATAKDPVRARVTLSVLK